MSDCTRSERWKWWSGGSVLVAFPWLIDAAYSFWSGQALIGQIALYASAGAALLYLLIVRFIFEDEFIEMGILPILILDIFLIIVLPILPQVRHKVHSEQIPYQTPVTQEGTSWLEGYRGNHDGRNASNNQDSSQITQSGYHT